MIRTATRVGTLPFSAKVYRRYNSSKVSEIGSLQEFNNLIATKDKLSVVDFYATWCGPCKAVSPIFDKLAEKVPEVDFARVDVDKAQEVAMEYRVSAMPTFLLFQNGEKVETIVGADLRNIFLSIGKYSGVDLSKRPL
ncbi:thioredoxin [Metschnikowia bicuspidata]|uniref:Thioredoxin n=1 Tax=Metschnikowia bicuspidata TaxID=27322 RepID=A0A4P9ZH50_9ASCO|nr:thioredoxin [Metschnikowia bicuspidata]